MQTPDIKKLEEFLARTPVLVAGVCQTDDRSEWREKRMAAVLAGAPLNEVEREHRELAEEFERRIRALGNGRLYAVIDHTHDNLSSPEHVRETLTRKYNEAAGGADGSLLKPEEAQNYYTDINDGICNLFDEEDGFRKPCFIIQAGDPGADPVAEFARWLGYPETWMRTSLPISRAEYDRMTFHHESFGHGTEDEASWDDESLVGKTNGELRADIAAIIGIIHDTGNVEAARSKIFARDLASLRRIARDREITENIVKYANGRELRRALKALPDTPDIRKKDDRELVRLIDETFAPLALDKARYHARKIRLKNASRLVSGAEAGGTSVLARMMSKTPKRLGGAISFLQNCMEAHAFFMNPAKMPRPAPAPVPRQKLLSPVPQIW